MLHFPTNTINMLVYSNPRKLKRIITYDTTEKKYMYSDVGEVLTESLFGDEETKFIFPAQLFFLE